MIPYEVKERYTGGNGTAAATDAEKKLRAKALETTKEAAISNLKQCRTNLTREAVTLNPRYWWPFSFWMDLAIATDSVFFLWDTSPGFVQFLVYIPTSPYEHICASLDEMVTTAKDKAASKQIHGVDFGGGHRQGSGHFCALFPEGKTPNFAGDARQGTWK